MCIRDRLHNNDLRAQADALKAQGIAPVGNMQCTIWETSWSVSYTHLDVYKRQGL